MHGVDVIDREVDHHVQGIAGGPMEFGVFGHGEAEAGPLEVHEARLLVPRYQAEGIAIEREHRREVASVNKHACESCDLRHWRIVRGRE